jgi:hypothetical protein
VAFNFGPVGVMSRLKARAMTVASRRRVSSRACLDFCVLRHSMSTERDMYATQDDEESDSPIIGAAA